MPLTYLGRSYCITFYMGFFYFLSFFRISVLPFGCSISIQQMERKTEGAYDIHVLLMLKMHREEDTNLNKIHIF